MRHLRPVVLSIVAVCALAHPLPVVAESPLGLNKAPEARIDGPAQEIHTGERHTFSGEGSTDPDGQVAAYRWSVGPGAVIVGSDSASTVDIRFDTAGPASVSLAVTDNGLLDGLAGPLYPEEGSTSSSFDVTFPPNRPPVFLADRIAQPQSTPRGYFSSSNVSFMDPDGDDVNIVSVECSRCRQPSSISTNANKAGTTEEQIEGYTAYAPCLPQNVGITITIDDGHGHQLTKHRTLVVYSGPAYNC